MQKSLTTLSLWLWVWIILAHLSSAKITFSRSHTNFSCSKSFSSRYLANATAHVSNEKKILAKNVSTKDKKCFKPPLREKKNFEWTGWVEMPEEWKKNLGEKCLYFGGATSCPLCELSFQKELDVLLYCMQQTVRNA